MYEIIDIVDGNMILKYFNGNYYIKNITNVRIVDNKHGSILDCKDGFYYEINKSPDEIIKLIRESSTTKEMFLSKIAELETEIGRLKEEIKCIPGYGREYLNAKQHFENNQM